MSRVRRSTFSPGYRMDRLERSARALGLDCSRDGSREGAALRLGAPSLDREWTINPAGRTTVRIRAFVAGQLDSELVVSDANCEAVLTRIAGMETN